MLTLRYQNDSPTPLKASTFRPLLHRLPPVPEKEVELWLVDDLTMRRLNRETRGLDKPTDVLSFANREIADPAVRAASAHSLGQIVISMPAAQRNADEIGQSLKEELHFLFVHGVLHILGYDHQTSEEELEMMSLAYRILRRKGVSAEGSNFSRICGLTG